MSIKIYKRCKKRFLYWTLFSLLPLIFIILLGVLLKFLFDTSSNVTIYSISKNPIGKFHERSGKNYLVRTDKGIMIFNVEENNNKDPEIKELFSKSDDELNQNPYKSKMFLRERPYTHKELDDKIKEKAELEGIDGNKIIFSKYLEFQNESKRNQTLIITIGVMLAFTIFFLLFILCIKRSFKTIKNNKEKEEFLLSKFRSINSLESLDDIAEYVDDELGVVIHKGYLILFAHEICYFRLEDIIWLYGAVIRMNFSDKWLVGVGDKTKHRRYAMGANQGDIGQRISDIADFLDENYPDIANELIIGFGSGFKKEYLGFGSGFKKEYQRRKKLK